MNTVLIENGHFLEQPIQANHEQTTIGIHMKEVPKLVYTLC